MRIALIGYGRMGKAIEGFAIAKGHEISLKIDKSNSDTFTVDALQDTDVAIDFSLPTSAYQNIKTCIDANVPVVSGTTGWLDKMEDAKAYCTAQQGAFLYASNFSVGMNIFFEVNAQLAKLMNAQAQYEISMKEIHHIHKLDSPSGTAITLAQQIIDNVSRKDKYEETANPSADTIAIHSERIDMTPGTHGVVYSSAIDDIEITHTAHSRDGFAKGALLASEWLFQKQTSGIFSMKDVLFG